MEALMITIFFFFSVFCYSQTAIRGIVKDSKANEPLSYCSISIKGTLKGTISNEEGVFSISGNLNTDTLIFSYVGYDTQKIPLKVVFKNKVVLLNRKDVLLQEVTIHSNDDFLYEILDQCRKKFLKDQTKHVAKVYYGLETQTKDRPIEMLECYYNGYLNGTALDKILLKNGRIGLAELDSSYFLTLNTSKAICSIGLTDKNDNFPLIPLQLSKRELKKMFILKSEYSEDKQYEIKFTPRADQNKRFSGEVWIDGNTFSLLKIDLTVKNAFNHPFLPLFSKDSILNVDLSISYTYKQEGSKMLLDIINFNYDVRYKRTRDSLNALVPSIITRDINAKGVLYFYDYENPFILPYFEYDENYDDYRKMSIIPYNAVFWKNNNTLILTKKQKENLGFFAQEGYLVNFDEGNYGNNFLKILRRYPNDSTVVPFFEFYYAFWSEKERIELNRKLRQNEIYPAEKINQNILSDLYNLKVQILLDITQLEDSLNCKSYTVFDADKTFYHLPEQPCTKAFLNIFFDICQIERREMEKELQNNNKSLSRIDSVYKNTLERIDNITHRYLKEVKLGTNETELEKWNQYVMKNLNIDNIRIFQGSSTGKVE